MALCKSKKNLTTNSMKSIILVTGATGHLGGSVLKHLLKKIPADQVVALVRNEIKADALREAGVTVRFGDYHDPASLKAAFANVDKAILVSSSDFNDRLGQHKNVIDAAKSAGVSNLVYTGVSLKDVNKSVLRDFMIDHFQTEDYIRESGITYTFMQHNLYAEMIPFYIGNQVLEMGIVFPAGDGRIPFALRDEMGEANANVLTGDGHENKTYNIANTIGYSFQDIADIISELTGKEIAYTNPDLGDYLEALKAKAVSEMMVKTVAGISTAMRNGDFDIPGNDLAELLRREPTKLREYLKSNIEFFAR
jgi:NAD(P)H dehydrogenase (quinone)